MAEKTIKIYLLLEAFTSASMSVLFSSYVLFLLANGLNLFQANLVNAIFMLTLFIAEIPTGAIADTWGRKVSFLVSCLLIGIGALVYYFSCSFWGFVLGEVIFALGSTCASGAFEAWLVDTLAEQNYEGTLESVFIRSGQINKIAVLAGGLSGAYLFKIDIALPYLVCAISFILTGIIAYFLMSEEYFVAKPFNIKNGLESMKETMFKSIGFCRNSNAMRFAMLIGCVNCFCFQAVNMYWQPLFAGFNLPEVAFGWIWLGISVMSMFGAGISRRLVDKADGCEKSALLSSLIFSAMFVILTSLSGNFIAVLAFFLIHEIGRGMFGPIYSVYINKRIPSAERATLISVSAMGGHVGSAFGLLLSGAIAQLVSVRSSWLISGSLLIISAIYYLRGELSSRKQSPS